MNVSGGTLTFIDKNVGTGKTVTISGAGLAGADAGNYVFDTIVDTNASIAKAHLVLIAASEAKVNDGTDRSCSEIVVRGLASGDHLSATQRFDSKNAGIWTLSVESYTLDDGNGGANYVVTMGAPTAGTIAQRLISTTAHPNDKVYDGTVVATGSFDPLSNVDVGGHGNISGGTLAFNCSRVAILPARHWPGRAR